MRRLAIFGGAASALLGFIYFNNASWLADYPEGTPGLLAHRGIHQTFSRKGLTRDTCTAKRIDPPTNPYLENSIPSMQASFAAGATALELDVHPTADGEFAVFHDWRLECRTNGKGQTRDQSMAYLKTLDIGHGYTADQGKTYPFRGKGVGLIPTLYEVYRAFPSRQFLINIKSNDPTEADRLIDYLQRRGIPADERLWIFADKRPRARLEQIAPRARIMSKKSLKWCSVNYLAVGWTGHVPQACRAGFIAIPINLTGLFWGWPNRLLARMADAKVTVLLVGPVGLSGPKGIGVAQASALKHVPPKFPGYLITDNVEIIGPAMRRKATTGTAR